MYNIDMIIKLNRRKYVKAMYGRGIYGKYSKVRMMRGYGIVDSLGSVATKHVLGGVGKSTGAFYGKQLGKLLGDKTGSKLFGSIAKSALGALGGLAGDKLGSTLGNVVASKVFPEKTQEKKKKKEEKVSLSQLLDQARQRITGGQSGNGLMLNY